MRADRLVCCLVCLGGWTTIAHSQVLTVALSGDAAPGLPGQELYQVTRSPSINLYGEIAFGSGLSDDGGATSAGNGIWLGTLGNSQLVATAGTPVGQTGTQLTFVDTFRPPPLNNAGELLLAGSSAPSSDMGDTAVGLWKATTAGLTEIFRAGDAATTAGPTAEFFRVAPSGGYRINQRGDVSFAAQLVAQVAGETEILDSLWLTPAGGLPQLIAAEAPVGGPADTSTPPIFRPTSNQPLSPSGKVAFGTAVSAPGGGFLPVAVAVTTPTGVVIPLVNGQTAPGLPDSEFGNPVATGINGSDQVVSEARLGSTESSLWVSQGESLALIVKTGDPAPGMPAGETFTSQFYEAVINRQGNIAFYSSSIPDDLSSSTTGIWKGDADSLELIVKDGDPAPGTEGVFRGFIRAAPVLNSRGQVAFSGALEGEGLFTGIWATDVNGVVTKIAKEGDLLEVAPEDFRTISGVRFVAGTGNQDGRASGFNDVGQLAFQASFEDGSSGVFLSEAVAFLQGDYNGNGQVTQADYNLWKLKYGSDDFRTDGNDDGIVDSIDYAIWRTELGARLFTARTDGSGAPEPGTLVVALITLVAALVRRSQEP